MKPLIRRLRRSAAASATGAALVLIGGLATLPGARADEAEAYAKNLLKAMSDYLAAQDTLSFEYDSTLEIVTDEEQKLALAGSGMVTLKRPDKIHATRNAGFANVEMLFDGTTLTVVSKDANRYTQIEVPGTIDHLVDELRDTYKKPLPGADLLLSNIYGTLMPDVVDTKDLGVGVIGGVTCDHLAFRTNEVDWQIWIAQGDQPYPCRYVITSKGVAGSPQYSVQIRDWKTGADAASEDFAFKNPTDATKVALEELSGSDDLPKHFKIGGAQ
jgi:hypothetical protein